MFPLMIVNYVLYPPFGEINEKLTGNQALALQQRNSSIFSLAVIQMQVSFIIGFLVSDRYFRLNPSKKTMFDLYKIRHPDMDLKYLEETDKEKKDKNV